MLWNAVCKISIVVWGGICVALWIALLPIAVIAVLIMGDDPSNAHQPDRYGS